MPGKKSRFTRALLWVLAVIVASELGLRLFGYGNYVIYRPDQRLLWVPLPGHRVTEANHEPITISADGFRYREKLGPKKKGQVRVFTFGDSVAMGWGVGDDSTYSAVLERLLNANCANHTFQVVNAGLNAYSNSLVVERIKKVVEDNFQPDIAIFDYAGNTRLEGLADLQGTAREKFLDRVRLKGWIRRSAIYNFVIEDLLRTIVYYRLRHMLVAGSLDTAQANEELDVARFKSRLAEALQLCQSKNIKMIFLVTCTSGERTLTHPFQQAMLEFGQANNVPVLNMADAWKSMDHEKLFQDYGHPSPEGHALIAEQLLKTIRELDSYCPVQREADRQTPIRETNASASPRAPGSSD